MKGRPPKPTELKRLAGNPGKRALNDQEPKPRRALPRCPDGLSPEAVAEWKRVSRELYDLGLLTKIDRAALAMYCQAWSTWLQAEARCQELGDVTETSNGTMIQSPWRGIANKSQKLCQSLAAEFGMTPSSRSRIKADPVDKDLGLAEQLFQSVRAAREQRAREVE